MQYTILIQWSDEGNCFVVFLPERASGAFS
jgi:predicted RNase H-like HicB family nuclease